MDDELGEKELEDIFGIVVLYYFISCFLSCSVVGKNSIMKQIFSDVCGKMTTQSRETGSLWIAKYAYFFLKENMDKYYELTFVRCLVFLGTVLSALHVLT